eukprot:TRINITY_DN3467_c0_g1_i1.p1 TRINITY_DN3467_c0_g1~~TRINITY_DN3467_c0_g1_i1.p1  ORF type:complete len:498 (-),score=207.25 TRINITY_DN3467_c0_g1_i1:269-1705(-)
MARPTAVIWSWRADDDTWKEYTAAQCIQFEKDYSAKSVKTIKVDNERFLDLQLASNPKKILENFTPISDTEGLIGMQRRFDDEMKRRAVKRIVPQFFDEETFFLALKAPKKGGPLRTDIETYGGVIVAKLTSKVSIVVADKTDLDSYDKELKEAVSLGVVIVDKGFVVECIKLRKAADSKNFVIDYKPPAPPAPAPAPAVIPAAPVATPSPVEKRKLEDAAAPAEKKAKPDVAAPASSFSTPTPPVASLPEPSAELFAAGSAVKAGSQWTGVCTLNDSDENFPMVMQVLARSGADFSGEVHWPTMNSAKTKFRGKIQGDNVTFEEYEAIQGAEELELPSKYIGQVSGNSISGKVDDPDVDSTFKIDRLGKKPNRELDAMKEHTTFEGVAMQPMPFSITITKRTGSQIEGVMTWPSNGGATSKVRGTIEGGELMLEQFDATSPSLPTPTYYIGQTSGKKVGGKFKSTAAAGTFEFALGN